MPIDYSAPRRGIGKSKLAALRIAAGLTQEELARLSGVSVFVVKEIEAGRTNRRTLESLVRIAAAIGVRPNTRRPGQSGHGPGRVLVRFKPGLGRTHWRARGADSPRLV